MNDDRATYFARIGDETHEVVVDGEEVIVDGIALPADLSTLLGSDRRHLRIDGRSLPLFARRNDRGWVIELEGRQFEVTVEDERTRRLRQLAAQVAPVHTIRKLTAPMPGLIVRVEVEEGQDVEPGDGLVVMEAMKMENELKAEAAVRISSIEVGAGQVVERDAVLLTMEPR
jgi:acetyl/propionyl-CoA carboxylase alpha subunit